MRWAFGCRHVFSYVIGRQVQQMTIVIPVLRISTIAKATDATYARNIF
jgi:hypothetical protein